MSTDVNSYAKNLLATRGRRSVATLLTWMEAHVWSHLEETLQQDARSKIMSVIGDFQDLAMDMVAAETGTINDFWVEELDKLHRSIRRANGGRTQVQGDRGPGEAVPASPTTTRS